MEQCIMKVRDQTQKIPWLVNNILFCYEGDYTLEIRARKSSTSYNTKGNTVVAIWYQNYQEYSWNNSKWKTAQEKKKQ